MDEYFTELNKRRDEILEIEEQLRKFTKIATKNGFRCSEYHIFPFDTKVISVVIGNYLTSSPH